MHLLLILLGCPAPEPDTADDTSAAGDTAADTDTDTDTDTDDTADTDTTCTPMITVTPAALDFGTVSEDGATEMVVVRNVGCSVLEIVGVSLAESTSPAFTMSSIGAVLVPPAAETSLTVTCTPLDAATATGTLVIYSDDAVNPEVEVPLTCVGEG